MAHPRVEGLQLPRGRRPGPAALLALTADAPGDAVTSDCDAVTALAIFAEPAQEAPAPTATSAPHATKRPRLESAAPPPSSEEIALHEAVGWILGAAFAMWDAARVDEVPEALTRHRGRELQFLRQVLLELAEARGSVSGGQAAPEAAGGEGDSEARVDVYRLLFRGLQLYLGGASQGKDAPAAEEWPLTPGMDETQLVDAFLSRVRALISHRAAGLSGIRSPFGRSAPTRLPRPRPLPYDGKENHLPPDCLKQQQKDQQQQQQKQQQRQQQPPQQQLQLTFQPLRRHAQKSPPQRASQKQQERMDCPLQPLHVGLRGGTTLSERRQAMGGDEDHQAGGCAAPLRSRGVVAQRRSLGGLFAAESSRAAGVGGAAVRLPRPRATTRAAEVRTASGEPLPPPEGDAPTLAVVAAQREEPRGACVSTGTSKAEDPVSESTDLKAKEDAEEWPEGNGACEGCGRITYGCEAWGRGVVILCPRCRKAKSPMMWALAAGASAILAARY